MEIKIAIQGIKGSFHHQVAQEYFGVEIQSMSVCL
jgi:prephenate dehydratase